MYNTELQDKLTEIDSVLKSFFFELLDSITLDRIETALENINVPSSCNRSPSVIANSSLAILMNVLGETYTAFIPASSLNSGLITINFIPHNSYRQIL
jgi:hypothetical protein